jgi:hypothetical protein
MAASMQVLPVKKCPLVKAKLFQYDQERGILS